MGCCSKGWRIGLTVSALGISLSACSPSTPPPPTPQRVDCPEKPPDRLYPKDGGPKRWWVEIDTGDWTGWVQPVDGSPIIDLQFVLAGIRPEDEVASLWECGRLEVGLCVGKGEAADCAGRPAPEFRLWHGDELLGWGHYDGGGG